MAESELSVSYSDLMAEVAAFLGYGSDSAAWSVAQTAEVDRHVQAGVRRFYYPPASENAEAGYPWSFLSPIGTLDTVADQGSQELPANLGRVIGGFHYEQEHHRRPIVQISEDRYQALLSRSSDSGQPEVACVRHRPKDGVRGQRLDVAWWPIPDAAYTLTFKYEAFHGKLAADNPYPLGGMRHAEVITEACLSVAEQRANDERGLHTLEFERLLAAAIQQDRRQGAQYYGQMGEPCEGPGLPRHGDTGTTYPLTYNGVDIT